MARRVPGPGLLAAAGVASRRSQPAGVVPTVIYERAGGGGGVLLLLVAAYLLVAFLSGRLEWLFNIGGEVSAARATTPAVAPFGARDPMGEYRATRTGQVVRVA